MANPRTFEYRVGQAQFDQLEGALAVHGAQGWQLCGAPQYLAVLNSWVVVMMRSSSDIPLAEREARA